MTKTLTRQSQIDPTYIDVVGYHDDLAVQLDAVNNPETASGVTLISGESITFSVAGSTITLGSSNPQVEGIIPSDSVTVSGSTSDDGVYEILSVASGVVIVDHVFVGVDGGSALGTFVSVRNTVTDLNFMRAQFRRIINGIKWFSPVTSPVNAFWDRTGNTLVPKTTNDNIDLGSGNILTSGTVDGRDVSVDGSSLDNHLDGTANKHDASEVDVEGTYANIVGTPTDLESTISAIDTVIGSIVLDRLVSTNSNLILSDNAIDQTLAGNLGILNITATGAIVVKGRDIAIDGAALDNHLNTYMALIIALG